MIESNNIACLRYRCLEDLSKEDSDLCLIYAGWEFCNPGYTFGPNMRTTYVLHVVKKGTGVLLINNKKYILKRGDAFIIRPHVKAWYTADLKDPWAYMWFGFTGYKAEDYLSYAGFIGKEVVRTLKSVNIVEKYLDDIFIANKLSKVDEIRRNAILMNMFSDFIEEYNNNLPSILKKREYPVEVYVKNAAEYINMNMGEKIKVSDIANHIGINRSYLTTCFKKIFGKSPFEYILEVKMNTAKKYLLQSNLKINEIASMTGYDDQITFSKAFKSYYGISPREYRKLNSK